MTRTLKVIILDFDGVLIESNSVKDQAFETVFSVYPEKLGEIMRYHRTASKIRFEKFRHIYENILKEPYTPEIEARCSSEFSRSSVAGSIACSWVKGAQEFLNEFKEKFPMYLASINPQDDLETVLKGREIEGFFKGVLTATSSKVAIIREILERESARPEEAVFVGDSLSDHRSALETGVPFIGRQAEVDLSGTGAPFFNDMVGVREYLQGLVAKKG